MITFLFWNTRNQDVGSLAAAIADEHEVDVILVAESPNRRTFQIELNRPLSSKFYYLVGDLPSNQRRRVEIYFRLPRDNVRALGDDGRLRAVCVSPLGGEDLLVVGAHLPSKMPPSTERVQDSLCAEWARTIRGYEEAVGHSRTVLVGDLNMNPFEPGLIAANGLHAAASRRVAERGHRRWHPESTAWE